MILAMSIYRFRLTRYFSSVAAISLIIIVYLRVVYKSRYSNNYDDCWGVQWTHDDEIVALRAQLGYCKRNLLHNGEDVLNVNDQSIPMIYAITPTYARPHQRSDLTRMCNTLLLVPNLHWIIIEDSPVKTELVKSFLSTECGVTYTHLNVKGPEEDFKDIKHKPKGLFQRNAGLKWLRQHLRTHKQPSGGVLYFADDDNTYSMQLFEEMRYTRRVSVWPVAFAGGLMVEKPKVEWNEHKQIYSVIGWDEGRFVEPRPFGIDMAGFAVNLQFFLDRPKAQFPYGYTLLKFLKEGYSIDQESAFLSMLGIELKDLEPKADGCTKVYVWHTKTKKPNLIFENDRQNMHLPPSNTGIIV